MPALWTPLPQLTLACPTAWAHRLPTPRPQSTAAPPARATPQSPSTTPAPRRTPQVRALLAAPPGVADWLADWHAASLASQLLPPPIPGPCALVRSVRVRAAVAGPGARVLRERCEQARLLLPQGVQQVQLCVWLAAWLAAWL